MNEGAEANPAAAQRAAPPRPAERAAGTPVSRGRTIVFIDNANIFHGQLNAGWRIDFKKLHTLLAGDGEIWQAFVFASVMDPPRYEQTAFYRFLKRDMRYEVML